MPQPVRKQIKEIHADLIQEPPFRTLLVDGNSLLFSCMADPKVNADGVHYGGVFQFLLQLRMMISKGEFQYIYVFFDNEYSGVLRFYEYPQYKANRDKHYADYGISDYMKEVNAKVRSMMQYFNKKNGTAEKYNSKEKSDWEKFIDANFDRERDILCRYFNELYIRWNIDEITEGDDQIAYYCLHKKPNEKIVIMSTDMDLAQLLADDVCIYNQREGIKKFITNKNFKENFGYDYRNVRVKKIFTGDASDNIGNIKGLSEEEFLTYKEALLTLTKNAFEICERCYAEMQTIERRFDRIDASDLKPLDKIYVLLQTCRAGTLNFSHLARCGFIASSFLKSFVAKGLLSEEEKMQITSGIKTVTGQFFDTVRKALNGEISKEACVRTYGHLRPGTYDITSPAYRSDPDKYLFSAETDEKEPPKNEKEYVPSKSLERMLRETFGVFWDEFYRFIAHAVAGREYSKFIFTRYISKVLDLIKAIGEEYGFDAEAMSHVPVDLVEDIRNGLYSRADIASLLKTIIAQGKEYNLITQSIELPPLITKAEDFYAFFIPKTLPNFIGNGTIEAEVVYLEHSKTTDGSLLSGKIVLIEQADPGFDWIFNYNIGGLITAYGGPNSHMSIRASEFNLPASIGVGESLFNKLKFARLVRLDCGAHQLTVLG